MRSFLIGMPPFLGVVALEDNALALDCTREKALGQPALEEDEQDQARQRREQGTRRERPEPDDPLDADELRQPERQCRLVGGLQQDEREEELVPGEDER